MELKEKDIPVTCEYEHLGLEIKECDERGQGYLASVSPSSAGSSALRNWRRTLADAYIVQVNDTPTYTKTEVEEAIAVSKEKAQKTSKPMVSFFLPLIVDLNPVLRPYHNLQLISFVLWFVGCMKWNMGRPYLMKMIWMIINLWLSSMITRVLPRKTCLLIQ